MIIENIGKNFIIEPTLVDEREQSGKNPFSPTQVYIEIKGKPKRQRISDSSSSYVSKSNLDMTRIKNAYKTLSHNLYEGLVRQFIEEAEARSSESLGEFLRLMHYSILRKQLGGLSNVSVSEMRYDVFDIQSGHTEHNEDVHKEQQVLYIGLHKLSIGDDRSFRRVADNFRKARQERILGENPKYIITPQNPMPYFRDD
ncbi:MAG: hypothetical protein HY513_04600 [Candidatus Aenigmarchaeota archaeon]|nr:hypothetical protein [Candidatus Aenigmarchaeota archaeon]